MDERPFLWKLCQDYVSHLEKAEKYDLALNPPPTKARCRYVIIADEVQALAPKEIVLITGLAEDKHTLGLAEDKDKELLLLYGKNQSRILCNRTYFSALGLPLVKFTKSLRNPHDVTLMANNAISAQLHFGNPDKEKEFQSEEMEPNLDKKEDIFWADGLNVPESMVGDPSLTIVALAEFVEEAKAKFKTSFVFTPEQIQGADCDNLVLYRMTSSPIFDYISANLPAEGVEASGNRAKASQYCDQEFSTGEIHSAFDAFHIALTRATKKATIFEEKSRKRKPLLNAIKKGVPLKPLSYQEEKAHVFNEDAWLAVQQKNLRMAMKARH